MTCEASKTALFPGCSRRVLYCLFVIYLGEALVINTGLRALLQFPPFPAGRTESWENAKMLTLHHNAGRPYKKSHDAIFPTLVSSAASAEAMPNALPADSQTGHRIWLFTNLSTSQFYSLASAAGRPTFQRSYILFPDSPLKRT